MGDLSAQRRRRSHRTAAELSRESRRPRPLDLQETAVTLLSLTRPELYTEHLALGRTPDHYEPWLADVLVASVLTCV